MGAGSLNRRLQFRRSTPTDTGFGQGEAWADHGLPIWGERVDVNDAEKWAAGQVSATIMSRFTVRASSFTRGLSPKDRLLCDGREWEIIGGPKESRAERDMLEITAVTGND